MNTKGSIEELFVMRAVPGHEVNSPWLPARSDVKSRVTEKLWDTWYGDSEIQKNQADIEEMD